MTRALCWLVLCAAAALAACGGGRATPEEALAALQAALRTGSDLRVLALHDADTRAFFRQRARTVRARLAAGEKPESVDPTDDLAHDAYRTGTLDEAAARASIELGQLRSMRQWLEQCTALEHTLREDAGEPPQAIVRVRAADGSEHEVFFVHEPEGWAFDAFRHYQELRRR